MSLDLRPFLAPKRVAVVGAGERTTSSGGAVMQMLRKGGFSGELIPVNPKGGEIFGLPARTSLAEI
ncbi:MAG: acyl-CoA synthetase, partial [Rhodospirillaceae bacterium]|nr:acyl-CoA synthetase [Rhodospirillaceae bacterium]